LSYQNDKKLRGTAGAVTVLHTHNRRLDFTSRDTLLA